VKLRAPATHGVTRSPDKQCKRSRATCEARRGKAACARGAMQRTAGTAKTSKQKRRRVVGEARNRQAPRRRVSTCGRAMIRVCAPPRGERVEPSDAELACLRDDRRLQRATAHSLRACGAALRGRDLTCLVCVRAGLAMTGGGEQLLLGSFKAAVSPKTGETTVKLVPQALVNKRKARDAWKSHKSRELKKLKQTAAAEGHGDEWIRSQLSEVGRTYRLGDRRTKSGQRKQVLREDIALNTAPRLEAASTSQAAYSSSAKSSSPSRNASSGWDSSSGSDSEPGS